LGEEGGDGRGEGVMSMEVKDSRRVRSVRKGRKPEKRKKVRITEYLEGK